MGNNTNLTVTQIKIRTQTTGLDANNRTRELGVKGTDQVTWFISLKRFCARSHSGALCGGVVKVIRQEPFQQRTVSQSIGFQVAQYQRNPREVDQLPLLEPISEHNVALGDFGLGTSLRVCEPVPGWPGLAQLGPDWPGWPGLARLGPAWPGLARLAWGTRQI